jgi:heat shock protein HslJ
VLNIRSGPGTNFPVIGAARTGDQGEIVGRSADGRWWAVSIPSAPGGIGWVSSDFVLATNAESVPVIASPPTPTPRPTNTPVPPRPTNTPAPQATATPAAQINFSADRTSIQQGQCATLSWSVQNVQAVWVYPRGEPYNRFPRTGQGTEVVCPNTTTTYEMRVLQNDGSVVIRQVTIGVTPVAATPTPVPPTATPAASTLPGTRWEVVNYNDGNALVTLISGTRITMEFGSDGQVRGTAGCNTYFASFQAGGSTLTIGQPGSTSQFCAEPAGVMDQEARFLSTLPRSASYRVDGNRLDIRSAADQIIIVANRAP